MGMFSGQGYAEGMNMSSQIQVQMTDILATFLYPAIVTFILLKLVDNLLGLRVDKDEETSGLDVLEFSERGSDI